MCFLPFIHMISENIKILQYFYTLTLVHKYMKRKNFRCKYREKFNIKRYCFIIRFIIRISMKLLWNESNLCYELFSTSVGHEIWNIIVDTRLSITLNADLTRPLLTFKQEQYMYRGDEFLYWYLVTNLISCEQVKLRNITRNQSREKGTDEQKVALRLPLRLFRFGKSNVRWIT